jgi:hypothetical protein
VLWSKGGTETGAVPAVRRRIWPVRSGVEFMLAEGESGLGWL